MENTTGTSMAAALLIALGSKLAAPVLSNMSTEQLDKVTTEIIRIALLNPAEREAAREEAIEHTVMELARYSPMLLAEIINRWLKEEKAE